MAGPGSRDRPSATVVVPAHDEALVVTRCLAAILGDADQGEFGVLVVSNGSTDDTAHRARLTGDQLGHPVDVLEIPTASKLAALRAAEPVLRTKVGGVRIYVDADVVVDTAALRLLRDAVSVPEPKLGLLSPDIDSSASSPLVRAYYRAWAVLARARVQGSGSGVFALNAAGAARVAEWPDVLNDDGFVVRQFRPEEKVLVDASARQFATRTVAGLIRRRARVVNGNRQLDLRWPLPLGSGGSGARIGELRSAVKARRVPAGDAAVFLAVTFAARALAAWRRWRGTAEHWSRDASTRRPTEAGGS